MRYATSPALPQPLPITPGRPPRRMCWLTVLDAIRRTDARGALHETGTGAAYCQIIDSIFGDVPMNRVKFEAKQEYEYLANYRILQNSFKIHSIDKVSRCARSWSTVSALTRTLPYTHRSGRFPSVSFPPPRLPPRSPSPSTASCAAKCKTTSSSCSGSNASGT